MFYVETGLIELPNTIKILQLVPRFLLANHKSLYLCTRILYDEYKECSETFIQSLFKQNKPKAFHMCPKFQQMKKIIFSHTTKIFFTLVTTLRKTLYKYQGTITFELFY